MMNREGQILRPSDTRETAEIIQTALAEKRPIEVLGNGTKRGLGRPVDTRNSVSLSGISGITLYQQEELVVTAGDGTSFKEIRERLESNRQHLAFEPINFGYFLNGENDFGSAGGQVACNISGPRRFKVGSVRDHVLGFRGVNGRGEIIKSGGNVVKNVTGYDLSKLICGSYGTLVALTEITFKVLPAPEECKTLVIHNQKLEFAAGFLDKATSSSNDISGAIFLPTKLLVNQSLSTSPPSPGVSLCL